jgi:hypothetical protein
MELDENINLLYNYLYNKDYNKNLIENEKIILGKIGLNDIKYSIIYWQFSLSCRNYCIT